MKQYNRRAAAGNDYMKLDPVCPDTAVFQGAVV
jgi:hypothetical protein